MRTLVAGVSMKMKKNNVTVISDEAVIQGRSSEGFVVRTGDVENIGKRLLIATGSVPSMPPITGLHEGYKNGFVLTNREILDLTEVPEKLVIIGGELLGLKWLHILTLQVVK